MAAHSSILAWEIPWTEKHGGLQSRGCKESEVTEHTGTQQEYVLQAVVAQLLSRVQLFVTPGTTACQASLSFTFSRSLLKLMSIESVMPSNHLILCHPLLLLPSIFPSIRVFSNELALRVKWPKY